MAADADAGDGAASAAAAAAAAARGLPRIDRSGGLRAIRIGRCLSHVATLLKRASLHDAACGTALLALRVASAVLPAEDGLPSSLRCKLAKGLAALARFEEGAALTAGNLALDLGGRLARAQALLAHAAVVGGRGAAGDGAAAIAAAAEAVALLEEGAGEAAGRDANVAEGLSTLARLSEASAPAAAEALHRRCLAARANSLGAGHSAVSVDMNRLAAFLAPRAGRLGDAIALAEGALRIDDANLEPSDTELAKARSFLAGLYARAGRHDAARAAYDAAIAANETAASRGRAGAALDLARDLTNRAALPGPGAGAGAEASLRRALTILASAAGGAPESVRRLSADPAAGRRASEPLLTAATADALAALGARLLARGRAEDAEPLLREAVRATAGRPRGAHLGNLACCLVDLGRGPDAVDFARRQLDLDLRMFGSGHANVAAAWDTLATALDLADRPEDATAAGRSAVAAARKSLGEDHPTTLAYRESWSGGGGA